MQNKTDKKKEIVLDVSEFEAPEPLIRAVVALESLKEDEILLFVHRMNPRHLFNEIAVRGLFYTVIADEPNRFELKIWREKNVSGS